MKGSSQLRYEVKGEKCKQSEITARWAFWNLSTWPDWPKRKNEERVGFLDGTIFFYGLAHLTALVYLAYNGDSVMA